MSFDPTVLNSIFESAPKTVEVCGFCADGEVYSVENIDENPSKSFDFSNAGCLQLEAAKEADLNPVIFHTHIEKEDTQLSPEDIRTAKRLEIPIYMFNVSTGNSDYYNPSEIVDLLGREFKYAHQNCWNLCKDYLDSPVLKDAEYYLESPKAYEQKSWNLYLNNLPTYFNRIPSEEASDRDLLLFKIGKTYNPNHTAILISLERKEILHQVEGLKSRIDPLNTSMLSRLDSVWRLKDA